MVPCPYFCYVVERLLRTFYEVCTRKYIPSAEELGEGFPPQLMDVSDTVALFKALMLRVKAACTAIKIGYWRERVLPQSSGARPPAAKDTRKPTTPSKKPKDQDKKAKATPVAPTKPKPASSKRPKEDTSDTADSDEEPATATPPVKKKKEGHTCYRYLMEHFKIGDIKCTHATCHFKHAVPTSQEQLKTFMQRFSHLKAVPSDLKDQLRDAISATL